MRAETANDMLRIISEHGRRFFQHEGQVARFHVGPRRRVRFEDAYSGNLIYTHYAGRWRGFTEGGTLRCLVEALRDYIMGRRGLPLDHLGPWPVWLCGGDLWAYGDDMAMVRQRCAELEEPGDKALKNDSTVNRRG